MTDHLKAILATRPDVDPNSEERRDWCKAASKAIAETCFEHVEALIPTASLQAKLICTYDGISACAQEGRIHIAKKMQQ